MQIWKIMLCELLIFTITISRYGYSTCMYTIFKFAKYYKILISCTNNDQIPFYLLVFTICLWGEQADQKHFDLGRCSIHNVDIYIVYRLKIGEFFLLKIGFNFFFLYRYFILYTINYTNLSKYLQIF